MDEETFKKETKKLKEIENPSYKNQKNQSEKTKGTINRIILETKRTIQDIYFYYLMILITILDGVFLIWRILIHKPVGFFVIVLVLGVVIISFHKKEKENR